MTQDPYNSPTLPPENAKGRNTTLIWVIVLLVLCCLCAAVVGLLWQFGDALVEMLGITL
jgi:hypothetical protein